VGELADVLGIKIWDVQRLEKRGVLPRPRREKRGKAGWRYWLRSDLEKIKAEFHDFSEADGFLEGHKVPMSIHSNKQITKFIADIVAAHSLVHPGEKIAEVVISFHLDKGEQPNDFEVFDLLHQRK